MAHFQFGVKALPCPMLAYCEMGLDDQIWMEFQLNIDICYQNSRQFFQALFFSHKHIHCLITSLPDSLETEHNFDW